MRGKYIRKRSAFKYSSAFKAELDRRYADYKNGTVEIITAEESKRQIEQILTQVKGKAS